MQVSGAVGLALLSTFATNHSNSLIAAHHPVDAALLSGYRLAYLLGIVAVLIGVVVAAALLRSRSAAGEPEIVTASGSEMAADGIG